jgi:hypothetical protein
MFPPHLLRENILILLRTKCENIKHFKNFEKIMIFFFAYFIQMYEVQKINKIEDISKELNDFVNSPFFFYLYKKITNKNFIDPDYFNSLLKDLSYQ